MKTLKIPIAVFCFVLSQIFTVLAFEPGSLEKFPGCGSRDEINILSEKALKYFSVDFLENPKMRPGISYNYDRDGRLEPVMSNAVVRLFREYFKPSDAGKEYTFVRAHCFLPGTRPLDGGLWTGTAQVKKTLEVKDGQIVVPVYDLLHPVYPLSEAYASDWSLLQQLVIPGFPTNYEYLEFYVGYRVSLDAEGHPLQYTYQRLTTNDDFYFKTRGQHFLYFPASWIDPDYGAPYQRAFAVKMVYSEKRNLWDVFEVDHGRKVASSVVKLAISFDQGKAQIKVNAFPGTKVKVQGTADLRNWVTVQDVTVGDNGEASLTDSSGLRSFRGIACVNFSPTNMTINPYP